MSTFADRAKMQPTGERRPPRKGEHFVTEKSRSQHVACALCDFTSDRDIVATPPEGYEYIGEVRQARERESFLDEDGELIRWVWRYPTTRAYPILRRVQVAPKPSTFKPGMFLPLTDRTGKIKSYTGPQGAKNLQYTGEYRVAKPGEYYLTNGVAYLAKRGGTPRPPRPILATPPEGYDYAGEYRHVRAEDEYLMVADRPADGGWPFSYTSAREYRVLTKIEPKPERVARVSDFPGYSETDALVWASKFADFVTDNMIDPSDVGTMTAWFATAIEAGRTAGQGEIADVRRRLTVARRERDNAKAEAANAKSRNGLLLNQIKAVRDAIK